MESQYTRRYLTLNIKNKKDIIITYTWASFFSNSTPVKFIRARSTRKAAYSVDAFNSIKTHFFLDVH